MIVALNNIGQSKNAKCVQSCRGFARSVTAGGCLIQDERESLLQSAYDRKSWISCLNVHWTGPCGDETKVCHADGSRRRPIVGRRGVNYRDRVAFVIEQFQ